MADALEQIVARPGRARTPQSQQADERQIPNSAGGWGFAVPGETRVHRFLTLGVEGGTFYAQHEDRKRELVASNAAVVMDWAKNYPIELVAMIREVSAAGRAPRNDPALFALMAAMALGNEEGRQAAAYTFPAVARTGTHLFTAAKYLEQFRGWGTVARRAFAGWYLGQEPGALAYQLVKYRQRQGWTHLDVLRSAHSTKYADQAHRDVFSWLAKGRTERDPLPKWIEAYELARGIERAQGAKAVKAAAYSQLIRDYPGLPWEALPDEATSLPEVWRALIAAGLPITALIRQLPKLTRLGVLAPMSADLAAVCARLRDPELLRKGRVHPVAVLLALKTYAAGQSDRGKSRWVPVPQIIDALQDAFYAAFPAAEPAGKRTAIAVDTSGSMTWAIAGYPFTAVEVAGALATVTMNTEPSWGVYGFSTELTPLAVSARMRLDDVMRVMLNHYHGGTDVAAPMEWARKNKVEVDTFQVITDNETWAGRVHPHQALEAYRQAMGIDARLQVVAVTPTDVSVADPDDPRQLDVSGFDSAAPALLADHSAGRI